MVLAFKRGIARLWAYGERKDGWAKAVVLNNSGVDFDTHLAMSEDSFGCHNFGDNTGI